MGLCQEFKRVLRVDLHSYWEVFYLDLLVVLLVALLTPLFGWSLTALGVNNQYCQFVEEHIAIPVENNVVKALAPRGLEEDTYELLTFVFIFLLELSLIHLIFCDMYRRRKQDGKLTIKSATDVDSDRSCFHLPQFMRRNGETDVEKKEKKPSLWQCTKTELARLWRLELHSCWEVFYIDALMLITSFILEFLISFILHFHLLKAYTGFLVKYLEKPVETTITRVLAPEGLDDVTYNRITSIGLIVCVVVVFHLWTCFLYLSKPTPKLVQSDDDVEAGRGCFSRSRVAPKEEKRPLVKTYQSVYSISSSSLYQNGSTEELIKKCDAFP